MTNTQTQYLVELSGRRVYVAPAIRSTSFTGAEDTVEDLVFQAVRAQYGMAACATAKLVRDQCGKLVTQQPAR